MIQTYISQITTQSNLSKQEALWLLEHITGKEHSALLDTQLTTEQKEVLNNYLHQIIHEQKPLSYIIGWVPFLDLKIKVTPPILIPRPETEEWVEQLIQELTKSNIKLEKILDIGTGSGAIALSLAHKFPQAEVYAVDINPQALDLAEENARLNNISNITFITSDLFKNLQGQKFDLIVSNPPYIPESMKNILSTSVTGWEDHQALFSGPSGLDLIENILKESHNRLKDNDQMPFQLVIEIDTTQHLSIQDLAAQYNWKCSVTKDLFGNWRTAWFKKP